MLKCKILVNIPNVKLPVCYDSNDQFNFKGRTLLHILSLIDIYICLLYFESIFVSERYSRHSDRSPSNPRQVKGRVSKLGSRTVCKHVAVEPMKTDNFCVFYRDFIIRINTVDA